MIAENEKGTQLLDVISASDEQFVPQQYSPLVASLVLAVHDNRILVVYDRRKEHWELPGGSIEPPESARQCAIRELSEESNQQVADLGLIWVIRFRMKSAAQNVCAAVFAGEIAEVRPFSGTEEIADIAFWPDAAKNCTALDGIVNHLVRKYLSARFAFGRDRPGSATRV